MRSMAVPPCWSWPWWMESTASCWTRWEIPEWGAKLGAWLVAVSVCCVCGSGSQFLKVEDEAHGGTEMMRWGSRVERWMDHMCTSEVTNGVCPEHKRESRFHNEFFRVDITELTQMPAGLGRPHKWVECAGAGWRVLWWAVGGGRELGRYSGGYSLGIAAHSSTASSVSRITGFLENVRLLDV